jgi:hypothetical protein
MVDDPKSNRKTTVALNIFIALWSVITFESDAIRIGAGQIKENILSPKCSEVNSINSY